MYEEFETRLTDFLDIFFENPGKLIFYAKSKDRTKVNKKLTTLIL